MLQRNLKHGKLLLTTILVAVAVAMAVYAFEPYLWCKGYVPDGKGNYEIKTIYFPVKWSEL